MRAILSRLLGLLSLGSYRMDGGDLSAVCSCVGFLMVLLLGQASIFQSWWSPGKAIILFVLLLVVPILVYYAARLWLDRGEKSRWGDVEAAWNVALVELSRQQVSLKDVPLFLLLGTDGQEEERGILQNADQFDGAGIPAGQCALHFPVAPKASFFVFRESARPALPAKSCAAKEHSSREYKAIDSGKTY